MFSLKTPLARARGLGSAGSGTSHWWAQRLSGVALVPLALWFVISLLAAGIGDYGAALAWAGAPVNATLLILLLMAAFHHAQLGLQVVIEDYVHCPQKKLVALVAVKLLAVAAVTAGIVVALKIAFTG